MKCYKVVDNGLMMDWQLDGNYPPVTSRYKVCTIMNDLIWLMPESLHTHMHTHSHLIGKYAVSLVSHSYHFFLVMPLQIFPHIFTCS